MKPANYIYDISEAYIFDSEIDASKILNTINIKVEIISNTCTCEESNTCICEESNTCTCEKSNTCICEKSNTCICEKSNTCTCDKYYNIKIKLSNYEKLKKIVKDYNENSYNEDAIIKYILLLNNKELKYNKNEYVVYSDADKFQIELKAYKYAEDDDNAELWIVFYDDNYKQELFLRGKFNMKIIFNNINFKSTELYIIILENLKELTIFLSIINIINIINIISIFRL